MEHKDHAERYRVLNEWFNTPLGKVIAGAFFDEIMNFNSLFSGDNFLQLGLCGENLWLDKLSYKNKFIASPFVGSKNIAVNAIFNKLPFERNSFDCILAPLALEAFALDKSPINEIDRVLKSMGYVIFFGVNPVSFWGLALKLGLLPIFGEQQDIKLVSVFSLQHKLLNMGYRQCALDTFYYIPPFKKQNTIKKFEFLNEIGKMLWLYPASFYCLIMQKCEIITPSLEFGGLRRLAIVTEPRFSEPRPLGSGVELRREFQSRASNRNGVLFQIKYQ